MDVFGIITKVLGPLGRRLVRRCLISVEVVEGKYVVYMSERGDSPYVDILLTLRVHNRNNRPTSVYAERFSAGPAEDAEADFPLPKVSHFGDFTMLGGGHDRIEIGSSSTADVTFDSRKHFRELPEGYLREHPLQVKIRVAETYGNRRDVIAKAGCVQVLRQ